MSYIPKDVWKMILEYLPKKSQYYEYHLGIINKKYITNAYSKKVGLNTYYVFVKTIDDEIELEAGTIEIAKLILKELME